MILQRRFPRPLSDLLETSGQIDRKIEMPIAGHRRLHFSFFTNEQFGGPMTDDGRQIEQCLSSVVRHLSSEPGL
jgi:hypothetical protein